MLDKDFVSSLVCPVSRGKLSYDAKKQILICAKSGLAYPIRDGIPVLLESEASKITATATATAKKSNTRQTRTTSADKSAHKPAKKAANKPSMKKTPVAKRKASG
jgi:uncharacterized protein YbaR (Trm112 family)